MEAKNIFENLIRKKYPLGIYHPHKDDSNYTLFEFIERETENFFLLNQGVLDIPPIYCYIIDGFDMNACAIKQKGHRFIGLTKGLILHGAFTFRNAVQSSFFFTEVFDHDTAP